MPTEEKEQVEIVKGIGKIRFEKRFRTAKIRSPLHNFEKIEQLIEYRRDPLTNHWSRINTLRAERVKQASAPGESYEKSLRELVEKSAKKCFFCLENIPKSTPRFPEELGVGDRISIGNFTLFPNLFVFSQYHAVGTLGSNHFTPLDEFPWEIWSQAIKGSIKFFRAVFNYDPSAKYPSINFNFLPPSASSIIHPHIQIIQDSQPTKLTDKLLTLSKNYSKDSTDDSGNSSNFWLDLVASEKKIDKRFIAENNSMTWLATFSPCGKNELTGILKVPKTDITTLSENEIEDLAKGIVNALTALHKGRGACSVNMALFAGPISEDHSDSFRINLKIVSRPTPIPNYTGDIGFMELLHTETIAEASPEIIAESVKQFF